MKYAIVDTESTGLFDFTKPADAPGQPRLAALGIVMLADDLSVIAEHEFLVKPDGWEMPDEAGKVNGLTMERLNAEGEPVRALLQRYTTLIQEGFVIASFNCQYDAKVMRGELRRAGMPDLFEQTPNVCVMRALTPICKVPRKVGTGYKFPKLSEACAFFKIEEPARHTALGDARSATYLLQELVKLKALPAPEVHYAKVQPERVKP